MSNTNTGGPAFPLPYECGTDPAIPGDMELHGMTLRDYFIAHAPAEPHFWFEPKMPEAIPEPPPPLTKTASWWTSDEGQILIKARQHWKNEYQKQRLLQWPAAWADEMLKAREA